MRKSLIFLKGNPKSLYTKSQPYGLSSQPGRRRDLKLVMAAIPDSG
jgi:hypothetical protein